MSLLSQILLCVAIDATSVGSFGWDPGQFVPVEVPAPSPLAVSYHRSGIWIWLAARAWTLLVPILLLTTRTSARLRDLSRRVGRSWFGTVAVYGVLFVGLLFLINLPLDFALGYLRPHAYGLSRQSPSRWLGEELKGLGLSALAAATMLWIPYRILRVSPRWWWAWTAIVLIPIGVGMVVLKPVAIDPMFNDFGPMKDRALEAKILALAGRAGIEGGRVFEVDKARDTTTVNAYVTGLFGTKRIVLWDTLLAKLEPDEVLAVMGHEMGHFALNHVAWGVGLGAVGSFALLFLIDRLGRAIVGRYRERLRFDRLADVASLPLLLVLFQGLNLLGSPIQLAASRFMEHEADRFSLELTRANHSTGSAFAKLQVENLAVPRPGRVEVFLRSSHPPIGERIDFCNAYHPWITGSAGRYDDRFRPGPDETLHTRPALEGPGTTP